MTTDHDQNRSEPAAELKARRRPRVKICGITSIEDARAAWQVGADALGFVFATSPREITFDRAREIRRTLPPFIAAVGLFVNTDAARIVASVEEVGLHAVQLSGDESPEDVRGLREALNRSFPGASVSLMKSVRLGTPSDIDTARLYEPHVDSLLFDSYKPGMYGGTGQAFEWEWLQGASGPQFGKPIIVAGGLRPDNVYEAIHRMNPFAVDVSSGVESAPGKKDPHKMEQFMAEVRRTYGYDD